MFPFSKLKRLVHFPYRLRSPYFKRRIFTSLLVFLVVYILNFLIPRLEPGNILSGLVGAANLEPAQREQLLEQLGINQPLWVQFIKYVSETFGSFPPSFGVSFAKYPLSVWAVIWQYLPWTLLLVGVSQGIAFSVGILLGATLAWRRGSKSDSVLLGISSFMTGAPSFWLATILIFVFAIEFHIFPPASTGEGLTGNVFFQIQTILYHAFLPILTLVLINLPRSAIVMRNTMVNVMQEDFIMAAKARGLKLRTLVFGHAVRNSLLPSIANLALSFGAILSGAYLVEITYSYSGMGYLLVQSVFTRDYPVLQGVFFFSAMLIILANILADIFYLYLDPRVEY